jgi:hypothetical protein
MKRALLVVVMLVAAAVGVGMLGQPDAEASNHTFTITKNCFNNTTGTITMTFAGENWTDDQTIRIRDSQNPNNIKFAGTNKSGDWSVTWTIPAKPAGYHEFRAEETAPPNLARERDIRVPCPRITISPGCGPAATTSGETYEIKITGANFPPLEAENGVSALITFDGAQVGPLVPIDEFGAFSTTVTVPRKASSYSITATDTRDAMSASATFLVPCLSVGTTTTTVTTAPPTTTTVTTAPPSVGTVAACVLEPPVGDPGFVTHARCSGFPGNANVTMRWAPGLGTGTAKADAAGNFRAPMLVFPRDVLGPRELIVESPGTSVRVPFLVVPPSVAPSGGDVATRIRPQLVIRY